MHTLELPRSSHDISEAERFLFSLTGARSIHHTQNASQEPLHPVRRQHYLKQLLADLDTPQDSCRIIHIGGSGGKGSVGYILNSLLRSHGFTTLFNPSPHLHNSTERILHNQHPIHPDLFNKYVLEFKPILLDLFTQVGSPCLTYFEAMVYLYFRAAMDLTPDFCIVEVGLGGTYDSTNIFKQPELTILTSIFKEHEEILGNKLKTIMLDKLGITRSHTPLIAGNLDPSLHKTLIQYCLQKTIPLSLYTKHFKSNTLRINAENSLFTFSNEEIEITNCELSLLGNHQIQNTSIALQALYMLSTKNKNGSYSTSNEQTTLVLSNISFPINWNTVKKTLKQIQIPGRLELLSKDPFIYLDGAHSPGKMQHVVQFFKNTQQTPFIAMVGFLADSKWKEILEVLLPDLEYLILSDPPYSVRPIQHGPAILSWIATHYSFRNIHYEADQTKALEFFYHLYNGKVKTLNKSVTKKNHSSKKPIGCITGSFYFVGAMRSIIAANMNTNINAIKQ